MRQRSVLWGLVLAVVVGTPGLVRAQPFSTDHFKCYPNQRSSVVNQFVQLRDQFDDLVMELPPSVLVGMPAIFCNPVKKTDASGAVTDITNPDSHLTMYTILSPGLPRPLPLKVRNQFGEQELSVFGAVLLAVPTQKNEQDPPSGLDHFKCYAARGTAFDPPPVVKLEDQFDTAAETVKVLRPVLFCNPAAKRHVDQETPIQNREDHLACYVYAGNTQPTRIRRVRTRDQFGPGGVVVSQSRYLCVPSVKTAVEPAATEP